jgi:hypothetical protein
MNPITELPGAVQFAIAAAVAIALIAFGLWAVRSGRGCSESPETAWPTVPALPTPERRDVYPRRASRRMRAGAPTVPVPGGLATLTPLPPQQCAAIARMAQSCAKVDFRQFGRPSGNPYSRHTRAYTVYAIEYAATWEELEHQFGRVV